MRINPHSVLMVSSAVLAVLAGQTLPRVWGDGMPQVAGDDVVAMVLGDVRQAFSFAMLEKADDYFHGGVHCVACEQGLSGGQMEHAHDGHDPDQQEDAHVDESARMSFGRDPWAWLNGQVHAQEHRHVEGEDTRELLPWLWAACRASPQNIQAYESAAYVLGRLVKLPEEAVRLLEEGVRKNPESAALEFSRGEVLLHQLREFGRAEIAFAAASRKCRLAEGPDGEKERLLKLRSLFYLGYLAKQRGDLLNVRACLVESEALDPRHVSTQALRKLLE